MENEERQEQNTEETQRESVAQTGSITAKSSRGVIHCITIVGQIEGHMELPAQNKTTKYEHIIPQITAVEESDEIDGLLVLLNTVGGDVEAGLAIAELIAGMRKPTVSLVLGGGHSIGVPLAVASQKSFIAPSAAMTIHPVRMNGMVIAVPQTYAYFQKIQERIVGFITRHSRVEEQTILRLMMETGELSTDVGTIVGAEQAVDIGLIDAVGTLSDALDCLHTMADARKKTEPEQNEPEPQS
ncbi:MAG: ClpP family protease [Intestinibacillus sp.]